MNDPNQFDEIAKRKLDEREFAFDEADWSAMQGLMAGRRSRRAIWLMLPLLLLIGGISWWAVVDLSSAPAEEVVKTRDDVAPGVGNDLMPAPAVQLVVPKSGTVLSGDHATNEASSSKDEKGRIPRPERDRSKAEGSVGTRAAETAHARSDARQRTHHMSPHGLHATIDGASDNSIHTTINTPVTVNTSVASGADMQDPPIVPAAASGAADVGQEKSADPAASASGHVADGTNLPPPSTTPDTVTTKLDVEPSASAAANDSATAGATSPPDPSTPLPTSRVEFSLMGGPISSLSTYSGGTSIDWSANVERKWSSDFGAEAMKMNAHFGFGGGIHFSTYEEVIRSNERSRTDQYFHTSYHLMSIDTTLLVVTGSFTDSTATTYYITAQLDTSVNMIVAHHDTTSVTATLREARDLFNIVSYVEVPLLVDAHTRSGHWNFGVRGGPTFGFLTARRGELPNASLDGYSDLREQQFSSMVVGYTARVYVRYALGPAWSIGIEPLIKGQLTSTLNDGVLTRKSSAFGGFLSLTYRLP